MREPEMSPTESITLHFPSETKYLSLVGGCVSEVCRLLERLTDQEESVHGIQLAVNEAVVNAVQHAYAGRADGRIEVRFFLQPDQLTVDVVDWGQSFDFPVELGPDPSGLQEGGRGLWLMQMLMDRVAYRADPDRGNRMRMVKELIQ